MNPSAGGRMGDHSLYDDLVFGWNFIFIGSLPDSISRRVADPSDQLRAWVCHA